MKIIHGNRQTGKTHNLIKLAYMKDSQIVCASEFHKRHLKIAIKKSGLDIREPITIKELLEEGYSPKVSVLIDDIDLVMNSIVRGSSVLYATTSSEVLNIDEVNRIR